MIEPGWGALVLRNVRGLAGLGGSRGKTPPPSPRPPQGASLRIVETTRQFSRNLIVGTNKVLSCYENTGLPWLAGLQIEMRRDGECWQISLGRG